MSKVRFAPAASIHVVRMTGLAVLAAGLFAVGLLSGPATASATNPPTVGNCSQVGLVNVQVVCVGSVTAPVTVNIEDNKVLNNNELNVLKVELEKVFVNALNPNTQVEIDTIAVGVVAILKNILNISVCQVKVIELGLTNLNLAKCS